MISDEFVIRHLDIRHFPKSAERPERRLLAAPVLRRKLHREALAMRG
jgi:hypothetical protein